MTFCTSDVLTTGIAKLLPAVLNADDTSAVSALPNMMTDYSVRIAWEISLRNLF